MEKVSGQPVNEISGYSRQGHEQDGVHPPFPQDEQGCGKEGYAGYIYVFHGMPVKGSAKGEHQNGASCGHDQPYGGGFQPFESAGDASGFFVPLEEEMQQKRGCRSRQYASQRSRDGSGNARYLQFHKGGCVDRQRAGRHLGERDDVRKHFLRDPAVVDNHLIPDHRDDGISSAYAECPDLHEGAEQLPQRLHHLPGAVLFAVGGLVFPLVGSGDSCRSSPSFLLATAAFLMRAVRYRPYCLYAESWG